MGDTFATASSLDVNGQSYRYYSLARLAEQHDISRLPFSLKILLENLLRHEDGVDVTRDDIEALCNWDPRDKADTEIAFTPSRVVLQHFTGMPALVDLAALRDASSRLGAEPQRINPLVPCDLVIDHSVQVDYFARRDALRLNAQAEFSRNRERYEFLKWGQQALNTPNLLPRPDQL